MTSLWVLLLLFWAPAIPAVAWFRYFDHKAEYNARVDTWEPVIAAVGAVLFLGCYGLVIGLAWAS